MPRGLAPSIISNLRSSDCRCIDWWGASSIAVGDRELRLLDLDTHE